ncbi:unnamed protein product [Hydatigera taeniaeformis]|uniref:Uncharacterized protein n=1 Tax=Hydatigena taeniaeformis TaxID=6205 RepID=A0A0R3WNZ2_HYDTA|nr:unnamed protein product [Hydatigera taeniaeformis]
MKTLTFSLLRIRRGDKKDAYCFSSSRKGSSRSCDEEEESAKFSITSLPQSATKPIVLTDVRPLASELRKTPSPVDFNAYAVEQKEIPYSSQPPRTKSFPNFLEEVETCLPKRRISRVNEPLQVEEASRSASDTATAFAQSNIREPTNSVFLQDVCATVPHVVMRKNDALNQTLTRHGFPMPQYGLRSTDSSAWLPIPRSTVQTNMAAAKSDSPHAIVRSRSPSSVHVNEARSSYGRPSASAPSDRHRRLSHPSIRPVKNSTNSRHQPDLKNPITFSEVGSCLF